MAGDREGDFGPRHGGRGRARGDGAQLQQADPGADRVWPLFSHCCLAPSLGHGACARHRALQVPCLLGAHWQGALCVCARAGPVRERLHCNVYSGTRNACPEAWLAWGRVFSSAPACFSKPISLALATWDCMSCIHCMKSAPPPMRILRPRRSSAWMPLVPSYTDWIFASRTTCSIGNSPAPSSGGPGSSASRRRC